MLIALPSGLVHYAFVHFYMLSRKSHTVHWESMPFTWFTKYLSLLKCCVRTTKCKVPEQIEIFIIFNSCLQTLDCSKPCMPAVELLSIYEHAGSQCINLHVCAYVERKRSSGFIRVEVTVILETNHSSWLTLPESLKTCCLHDIFGCHCRAIGEGVGDISFNHQC